MTVSAFMPSIDAAHTCLERLRARRPLVQNITNHVAMTLSANVLLALGASPAMVHAEEELEDFAAIADSLVVNIGTLDASWIRSMLAAPAIYGRLGKPFVLDPVGAGATRLRTETAARILDRGPAILRGNASEILSLAGAAGGTKGVDSTAAADDAIVAGQRLAATFGCVVAITGATDYVTDGRRTIAIEGGHALMSRSTALGCALSATTAAFAAVAEPLEAAVAALAVYGAAGAIAGVWAEGPGDLPAKLINALAGLDHASLATHAAIREL